MRRGSHKTAFALPDYLEPGHDQMDIPPATVTLPLEQGDVVVFSTVRCKPCDVCHNSAHSPSGGGAY